MKLKLGLIVALSYAFITIPITALASDNLADPRELKGVINSGVPNDVSQDNAQSVEQTIETKNFLSGNAGQPREESVSPATPLAALVLKRNLEDPNTPASFAAFVILLGGNVIGTWTMWNSSYGPTGLFANMVGSLIYLAKNFS